MVKFIRDQKSYNNHTASHTTNHTTMTPPERIAVQQSYNLLTTISLGGVRPIETSFFHGWNGRHVWLIPVVKLFFYDVIVVKERL